MAADQDHPPLMFVIRDAQNFRRTQTTKEAKAIASHISARYKGWNKINHKDLALDTTTKSILTWRFCQAPSTSKYVKKETVQIQSPPEINELDRTVKSEVELAANTQVKSNLMVVAVKPWENALKRFEEFVAYRLLVLGSQFIDPFTPSLVRYDTEIKANLYYYFKVIRPFATHLIPSWHWLDNLSQIQASPVLTYAVATYASIFLSGSLRGGPGVVLPPVTEKDQSPLWRIPAWLRLHTKCLAELNAILRDPTRVVDESCYQAVLFLYRLSVLLADGESGRMHFQALKRMSLLMNIDINLLENELAVSKVNIIGAFLHNASIVVVRKYSAEPDRRLKHIIEIDRRLWKCDREWFSHRACLAGRMLTWRPESPSANLLVESAAAITRMDPKSMLLGDAELAEMQRCYQIAVFFWMYLNSINFNTSALIIRSNLLELQDRLSKMDLSTMSLICYSTMLNVLLAGTNAARNRPERYWFLMQIVRYYPTVQCLDSLYQSVAVFFDPLSISFNFIKEIWEEIAALRVSGKYAVCQITSPKNQLVRPINHFRPTTYTPDLSRPIAVMEIQDMDETAIENTLHRIPL